MNENTLKPNTTLQGHSYTYTIQKVLEQGTFGITYLATTKVKVTGTLGEFDITAQVVIREFFMNDFNIREGNTVTCTENRKGFYDKYKQTLARKVETLSKLHHPNIAKMLEYFETNNTIYYAMEYVEGGDLDAYITQKDGLPEAECVKYAKQIGSALSYMHAHKMLYLELKPINVMLRKNGDAVLTDCGLSLEYEEEDAAEMDTVPRHGIHCYAPIEQTNYHAGKDFPVTIDIYSLGATMYRMLTGERPPSAIDLLNEGFPTHLLQECHISDSLIACVSKAMSPLKKNRPQSMVEFLEMIRKAEWLTSEETELEKDPIGVIYGGPPIRNLLTRKIDRIADVYGGPPEIRTNNMREKLKNWWHNKRK